MRIIIEQLVRITKKKEKRKQTKKIWRNEWQNELIFDGEAEMKLLLESDC